MLDFLVTSKARRRLLSLLFVENESGTATDFAARTSCAFAGVQRELTEMSRRQLATAMRDGKRVVYSANTDNPASQVLTQFLRAEKSPVRRRPNRELYGRLAKLGAPLPHDESRPTSQPTSLAVHETLLDAAAESAWDPTVMRVMPLVLLLMARAGELGDNTQRALAKAPPETRHRLGFLASLAGQLRDEKRLEALAEKLRDGRRHAPAPFFSGMKKKPHQENMALAGEWGYELGMTTQDVDAVLAKHGV